MEAKEGRMRLGIIIPTFNRKDHLANLLGQIQTQSNLQEAIKVEVIVAVDGSTDGTIELIESKYPQTHVVKGDGNWWYTESINQGFAKCESLMLDYTLTLNDDIILADNYLTTIISDIQLASKDAIIGSISVTKSTPHKVFFAGVKSINWTTGKRTRYLEPYSTVQLNKVEGIRDSKVLPGRGMLIPFKVAKQLQYFDPKFVQYGSDDDFCLRAQKAGYPVQISWNAVIYCYDDLTGAGSPRLTQSLSAFLSKMTNKYSPTSILKDYYLIRRNVNPLLVPVGLCIRVLKNIASYYKYQ